MTAGVMIRPARVEDAGDIVEAIRRGFEPDVLGLMIYGCPGIARFVAEQIAARGLGADTSYTVAVAGGRVVACVELRHQPDGLFLNYLSVLPEARSSGIGRALLREAIASGRRAEHRRVGLDVLDRNDLARGWYERLGFRRESASDWWDVPAAGAIDAPPALLADYPQAQVCHQAFGFSRFTLVTPGGRHAVGRLGAVWFRLTGPEPLSDPGVLAALARLDPGRRILAIVPEGCELPPTRGQPRLVAKAIRMEADIGSFD
jgi:ribosomal protein S18 acetylase RimI-like enzyme